MNHANRHILFGTDGHPTLKLLRQYQEGALSPALSHQLERHLLDCELCADIVEGMALSDTNQTLAAVTDIKERMASKKEKNRAAVWYADWRAAAAIVVLICSAVMVFYYQYSNLQAPSETIAVEQAEAKQPETIAKFSPPSPIVNQETIEEPQPNQKPILTPRPNSSKTIVAADLLDKVIAAEEVILDEETIAENSVAKVTESVVLGDVTFDLKQDSTATIAAARPKARTMATAPQMNLQRALEGQVAGVSVQRNTDGSHVVRGKVTDAAGNPLPGVAVQVKGTIVGVATDKDGNFSLQVPAGKKVLSFRYVGFETKEQQVDSANNLLAVNLQPDEKQLSEVVVTGYSKRAVVPVIEKPKPTIGQRAYKLYLKNEQRPLTTKVKGNVIVGFTVSEKGELQNVRAIRSLNPEADAEAVRLIQQGPAWEPAKQNGNPVARQVKVVVRFR
ncbi:TonB family protein [Pontibacter burrus]|uniref:TonB family protein n=1 Tax=Pontibacter burrus TaxID=2704466 RepID=A0A6B3LTQ3_9BACT|nr:TonB family protein [Pontibacter burrus]NEM97636.1 TonB family protein [Pontibacter burrus]